MIKTRTVHDDGSISITVSRLEKTIRAADGTIQKMVSFDGEVWRLEAQENKEAVRLQRSTQLATVRWKKKIKKLGRKEAGPDPLKKQAAHFNARHVNQPTGYQAPVILPVSHHGNAFLGKEQGKKQKYKRNLRQRKPDKEVKLKREKVDIGKLVPIHRHRCHGRYFVCQCPQPYFKRPCGGKSGCLRERKP